MLDLKEVKKLAKEGYTINQAASRLGCHYATISAFCDKHGIVFQKKQHASLQVSLSRAHLTLGSRLADLMVSNNVGTYEINVATGISAGVIKRFCYGIQDMRISDVNKICDYFGITMEEFFAGV